MRLSLFILLISCPIISLAQTVYKLEGKIGNEYPVVIELEEFDDGYYSGWYAYKSTLKKYGDAPCSWLLINPSHEDPFYTWGIRDCKPEQVETWCNVNFDNGKQLKAKMKNASGRTYDLSATVVSQYKTDASLTPYFKKHIGEMVCDFDMFNYLPAKFRLINLMGWEPYFELKNIYQTQGDMEYSKGMFWGSGFMAHQCCDPATVWAYDTHNDSFYVWIRKDGRDYWWSETGDIPIKFREIVSERF